MKDRERTIDEYEREQSNKPHRTVDEPTYGDLICWCKLNIKQLLTIGYADTDEHIEKHIEKHFDGKIGLLNVIDGYVQMLENLIKLERIEKE